MTKILEIQGLRAIAVILVILYHLQLIPGGFIGVDIFYVISGYLITNLIISEITDTGHLNILNFYKRRIKRLLPASAFVLLATALICYLLLPPMDRSELGKNLIAISLLVFIYIFISARIFTTYRPINYENIFPHAYPTSQLSGTLV